MGTIPTCIRNMTSGYETIIRMEHNIKEELAEELNKILKNHSYITYNITVSHVIDIRIELKDIGGGIPLNVIDKIASLLCATEDELNEIRIYSLENNITIVYELSNKMDSIRELYGGN